jgi:hypothetical protein
MLGLGVAASARLFRWESRDETAISAKLRRQTMTLWAQLVWGRAIVAGLVAGGLAALLVIVGVGGYAMTLAIQAQGAPDPLRISAFANQVAPWASTALTLVFTFMGARWAVRKPPSGAALRALRGAVVGLAAMLVGLAMTALFSRLSASALLQWLLIAAGMMVVGGVSGWIGKQHE